MSKFLNLTLIHILLSIADNTAIDNRIVPRSTILKTTEYSNTSLLAWLKILIEFGYLKSFIGKYGGYELIIDPKTVTLASLLTLSVQEERYKTNSLYNIALCVTSNNSLYSIFNTKTKKVFDSLVLKKETKETTRVSTITSMFPTTDNLKKSMINNVVN